METELISFADILTDSIWMRYFVKCQGYNINKYIVFQDNMRALSLEKNGRMSLSQRTKHITKAKYFLIKDSCDAGVINTKFCPTNQMWADILTKPLQGQKFRDMRAFFQNCTQDYEDDTEAASPMTPQDVASSRKCVSENTECPTCASQITAGGEAKVSWGKNRINTFPVNNNFSVGHTWESAHSKFKKFNATSQPYNFPIPSKGKTKAGRRWERK